MAIRPWMGVSRQGRACKEDWLFYFHSFLGQNTYFKAMEYRLFGVFMLETFAKFEWKDF